MSSRSRFVVPIILSALAVLAGCGSSSPTVTPPPTGGFSNSDLNGTYVFSFSGADALNGTFFAMAGVFTANGTNGGISGGTVDIIDGAYGALTGVTISSGSYAITADGRGRGTLTTNLNNNTYPGLTSIGIDFVLTSSSHGLIIRFDGDGTGSGTLDLQSSSIDQSSLTSYAFTLSGADTSSGNPLSAVGGFALNGGTAITDGVEDFNDYGVSTGLTALTLTGSVTLGSSGAAGQAVMTNTASSAAYNALTFDVWPVDATHFKLIETDGVELLEGDAFTQATTVPSSGNLVYTFAGEDFGNGRELFVSGGYLAYSGTTVSSGFEDINEYNQNGVSLSTVSGTLGTGGFGRYVLTLGGFLNGIDSSTATGYQFAAYPFTSNGNTGILVMEIDGAGVTGGTAFVQSATTFASSQGYGLNETGYNGSEVDLIAEFTAESSGTLSQGIMDENDDGSFMWKESLGSGGTYTFDSGGSGRGELTYQNANTGIGGYGTVFYVANSSIVPFIDADAGTQVGVGVIELQSSQSQAKSQAAATHTQTHLAVLRATSKKAKKK